MTKISPRFRWMVDMLPLDPEDRVLEVGCGLRAAGCGYGIALRSEWLRESNFFPK